MNEKALLKAAQDWLAQGERAVVVTVAQARGSVPREAHTRMVVSLDSQLGTIGGGHLEWQALQVARRCLAHGEDLPAEQRLALGPSLGQCCGGAVTLRYEWLQNFRWEQWPLAPARAQIWLYGAGHVGRAVALLIADLEIDLRWMDLRENAFPGPQEFPWAQACRVEKVVCDGPAEEARMAPDGSHHLVMTHSHALDFDIVRALLPREDLGLIGLIGSATKRARFEHRLQAKGFEPAVLERLCCPVGLPSIQGKEPAVIAVSVVAQLLIATPLTCAADSRRTDSVRQSIPGGT